MWHGIAAHRGDPRRIRSQAGALANCHSDQSQSRLRSKIRLRFRNDQPLHRVTCRVSPINALF
jgi:hypothetical protein